MKDNQKNIIIAEMWCVFLLPDPVNYLVPFRFFLDASFESSDTKVGNQCVAYKVTYPSSMGNTASSQGVKVAALSSFILQNELTPSETDTHVISE